MKKEAQIIEETLRMHRIPVRVLPAPYSYATSRTYVLQVQVANGQKVDAVTRFEADLDEALTNALHRDMQVRFQYRPLSIVIPRPDPQTIKIGDVLRGVQKQKGLVVTLGETHVGIGTERKVTPLRVDLKGDTTPHWLVAGTTGSGKSTLIKSGVFSLALAADPRTTGIILVDPKGRDYPQLAGLPHLVHPVITRTGDGVISTLLNSVIVEIERRTATLDKVAQTNPSAIYATAQGFMNLVIVIDEILSLWQSGNEPEAQMLGRIASIGRGVGVHLILGTQRPTKSLVGGDAMANLPLRCCGSVATMEEGKYATGIAGSVLGAHKLTGKGDFLLTLNGKIVPFQSPFVDVERNEDIRIVEGVKRWWNGSTNPWRLPMVESPRLQVATSSGSGPAMRRHQIDSRQSEVKGRIAEFAQKNGQIPSYTSVMNMFKSEGGPTLNFNTAKKLVDEVAGTLPPGMYGKEVKPQ